MNPANATGSLTPGPRMPANDLRIQRAQNGYIINLYGMFTVAKTSSEVVDFLKDAFVITE